MSEQLVDLREILQGLHDHEVDYVLFGATAMLFHGGALRGRRAPGCEPRCNAAVAAALPSGCHNH